MSTATQQDDDLLIIEEDTSSDTASDTIEFSFDTEDDAFSSTDEIVIDVTDEKTQDTGVSEDSPVSVLEISPEIDTATATPEDMTISFEIPESASPVEASSEKAEEIKVAEDFSFNLDMWSEASETIPETSVTSPIEEVISEPTSALPVETVSAQEESLNDILTATIVKLEARKEAIATDKSGKAAQEEDMKAKILELQEQVQELEAEMKALDAESEKITTNISELEKMKLDPVKEHNAKRVVKK